MSPVSLTVTSRKGPSRALASPLILIYVFAVLIAIGTALLLLPVAHEGSGFTPFIDALFTAASAVTVTGLVIQETSTYWTRAGQVMILGMMFVGGLGFMTIATFLLILIGQRVTLSQRLLVKESLGVDHMGGLVRLTMGIVLVAVVIQIAGFVALVVRFSFLYPPAEAVWQAVFHAVSGFNNAGFIALTEEDALTHFRSDGVVLGTIGTLIVLGAISFWVLVDIVRVRRFSLFALTTKLVLVLTTTLVVVGTVVFLASEYMNPGTLGPLPVGQKLSTSVFESISGRTAGFTTVNYNETTQHTNFFLTALMFIGGASGSVAGGIKINTMAVVMAAVLSTLRGRTNTVAFGREIPQLVVQRAMVVGAVSTTFVFMVAMLLTFSQTGFDFIDLLFEAMSAFGTVGLSTGLTAEISIWGQAIIVGTMFIGRLGPLAIGLAMAQRAGVDLYRYPSERVTIA